MPIWCQCLKLPVRHLITVPALHFAVLHQCDIAASKGLFHGTEHMEITRRKVSICKEGVSIPPTRIFMEFFHDMCQVMYTNFSTLQTLGDDVHASMWSTQISRNFLHCNLPIESRSWRMRSMFWKLMPFHAGNHPRYPCEAIFKQFAPFCDCLLYTSRCV